MGSDLLSDRRMEAGHRGTRWVEIYGLDWAPDLSVCGPVPADTRGKSGLLDIVLDGSVRTMLSTPNLELRMGLPSPDGRHLAIDGDSNSSNVWLLENF